MYVDLEIGKNKLKPIVDCKVNGLPCSGCVDTGADSFSLLLSRDEIKNNYYRVRPLNASVTANGATGSGLAYLYNADITICGLGELDKNDIPIKNARLTVIESNIEDIDLLIPYRILYKFGFELIKGSEADIIRLKDVSYSFSSFNLKYSKNNAVIDILAMGSETGELQNILQF